MNLSEISAVLPGTAAGNINRNDPKAAAKEFDAMLLEILLRQSGLLQSMGEEGTESALFGEMFLPNFARELAAQVDLGFGNLLINQAQQLQGEVTK